MRTASIDNAPNYHVSNTGTVFLDGKVLHQSNSNGYREVKINGERVYVHRLVALAFIPNPENKPYVNHLDGDPANNCESNLEWSTAQENAEHAYRTGLRNDNIEIRIKDHETGEYIDCYSLQNAAVVIGIDAGYISRYLKSRRDGLMNNRYMIGYKDEDWSELLKVKVGDHLRGTPRAVKATNTETNQVMIFTSMVAACELFSIPKHKVFTALNGAKRLPIQGWVFEYYSDTLPEDAIQPKSAKRDYSHLANTVRKPKPIMVKDTMTGHSVKWESSEAFANSIGVKKNSFQKRISQNRISKVSGMYDHYEITYI